MITLRRLMLKIAASRKPDAVIGPTEDAYLLRWHVIPRNPLFNVYLHQFLRSDDDRALHDHPWINLSILLQGQYIEHGIELTPMGWWNWPTKTLRQAGDWKFRWAKAAHRIELIDGAVWTLFITGPRIRAWGFHCPQGFVSWQEFTAEDEHGASIVGKGCGEP